MKLWPSTRRTVSVAGTPPVVDEAADQADDADPALPPAAGPAHPAHLARMLRNSPVLLLADIRAEAAVERLVRQWNPHSVLPDVADGVRWAGPFRLEGLCRADAWLPVDGRWSTVYAARAARSRRRVPDGLDAHLLRLRYPHGIPSGDEAVAWSLIMGLARRLDGAVRLPPRAPRGPSCTVVAQRPQAQENAYCVYGTDPLPWPVLQSVLSLSLPELDHTATGDGDGYRLHRPGSFELRVQPLRRGDFIPYALRPYAGPDWPRTTYRFRCVPQRTELDARRIAGLLRAAACQLADVVGGLLVDGDGFPLVAAGSMLRR
jgi:hypothetical protein